MDRNRFPLLFITVISLGYTADFIENIFPALRFNWMAYWSRYIHIEWRILTEYAPVALYCNWIYGSGWTLHHFKQQQHLFLYLIELIFLKHSTWILIHITSIQTSDHIGPRKKQCRYYRHNKLPTDAMSIPCSWFVSVHTYHTLIIV